MNKKLILFVLLGLLIPYASLATPLDFHGGVQNEHQYEEYVFITGEPILFRGTYTVRESSSRGSETKRYSFDLERVGGEGSIKRNVTFRGDDVQYPAIGQTTNNTEVDRYSERIRIDEDSYELEDYQFSKSDVLDSRPASDFYEGNIIGRRFYKINGNEGEVTIHMNGGNVGYENFWGSTETQIVDNSISYSREGGEGEDGETERDQSWTGTYSHQVSDSLTKQLRYSGNGASLSSIDGGHVKITNHSIVSKYEYSLPGVRGRQTLNQEMVPKVERLIVPKFRDVNGHWAEENIKKLYSLNVLDDDSSIFSPDTPMNRIDFTKAIIRASDIRVEEEAPRRRRRNEPEEEAYFRDTDTENENYKYIKAGVDKKVIQGLSSTRFGPEEYLTRAEAVTILMRSLGYEEKAPNPGYRTSFMDDGRIPNWAKDSIYMGQEIGLIRGDSNNRVNPNKQLTRAEASTLAINYLEFLEKGLQRDYRDNIIKYN